MNIGRLLRDQTKQSLSKYLKKKKESTTGATWIIFFLFLDLSVERVCFVYPEGFNTKRNGSKKTKNKQSKITSLVKYINVRL